MSKKIIDHQNVFDYHKKNKKQDYANNNRVSFVSEKNLGTEFIVSIPLNVKN